MGNTQRLPDNGFWSGKRTGAFFYESQQIIYTMKITRASRSGVLHPSTPHRGGIVTLPPDADHKRVATPLPAFQDKPPLQIEPSSRKR
jgi:hypothetical protein